MAAKTHNRETSRGRRWAKRIGQTTLVCALLLGGLWYATHRVRWLGPAIADGLRSVLGPGPVAWMEDVAYAIQDRVNMWRYDGEPPTVFWEPPVLPGASAPAAQEEPRFAPPRFDPPFAEVATPADGIWLPVVDPRHPEAPARMYKSLVHPDKRRGFAALAIVAANLEAFDLHLVAGTSEPLSNLNIDPAQRSGLVAREHNELLFAAFNGGFKATHGQYGMMLGGVEFLPPRDLACTFVRYNDGRYRIATWSDMKGEFPLMSFYRQTPPCLVEDGKLHDALLYQEYAKGWGATVGGDTIIRRSAVGLDSSGTTLFYGLGEAMTAQAIARGMLAAGAHVVAELDVNYSYPRMLFYEHPEDGKPPIATSSIIPNIDFTKYQYVGQASPRDFFYLTRRGATATGMGDAPVDARPHPTDATAPDTAPDSAAPDIEAPEGAAPVPAQKSRAARGRVAAN
jgi:hypothetical protein